MIIRKPDGYHVMSEDGSKHLGGPYQSRLAAETRLKQVEHFKAKDAKK